MMVAGGYLFLSSVRVYNMFSMGYPLFHWGPMRVTSGMTLFPLIIGVGMVFFNARSIAGWLLAVLSLVAICAGVIASVQFSLASMSLFELLVILVLFVGGAGLFLGSLKSR